MLALALVCHPPFQKPADALAVARVLVHGRPAGPPGPFAVLPYMHAGAFAALGCQARHPPTRWMRTMYTAISETLVCRDGSRCVHAALYTLVTRGLRVSPGELSCTSEGAWEAMCHNTKAA